MRQEFIKKVLKERRVETYRNIYTVKECTRKDICNIVIERYNKKTKEVDIVWYR